MTISSKSIISILSTLTGMGHEIVSCDFRTGEVTFRIFAVDEREDRVAAEYVARGLIAAIKLDRELYAVGGVPSGLAVSKARVEALVAARKLVYKTAPIYSPPVSVDFSQAGRRELHGERNCGPCECETCRVDYPSRFDHQDG